MKVEESQRLHCNEMSMIRWMCGVTMRDRYPCEELRALVGIKPIVDVMRQRRLRWFGHIERREDNSWLKKVQNLAVDGHSGRGRPRKTWEHVIMEDLRVKGLRREVAQKGLSKTPRGGAAIFKHVRCDLHIELVYDGLQDCVICNIQTRTM